MNVDELRRALREGPTPEPLDGHAIIDRVQRARRRAVGAVSALVAALLVGTLWLVWEMSRPQPATPRPQVQAVPITPPTPTPVRTPTPSPTSSRTTSPSPTPSGRSPGVSVSPYVDAIQPGSLCRVDPPQRLLDALSKPNRPVDGSGTRVIDAGLYAIDPATGATLEVQNSTLYYVTPDGSGVLAFPLPPDAALVSPQISGKRVLFGIRKTTADLSLTDWYTWIEGDSDAKKLVQLEDSQAGVIGGDDVVVSTQGPDGVGVTLLRIPFAGGTPQALATVTAVSGLQTWGTDSVIFIIRTNSGDSLTQRLTAVNVTTGTLTELPQPVSSLPVGAFAADGDRIAFSTPGGGPGLNYWEPGMAAPRRLIGAEAGVVSDIAMEGSFIVYRTMSSPKIGIVDLASGSWTVLPASINGRAFPVERFVLSANSLYLATANAPGRRDVLISSLPALGGC